MSTSDAQVFARALYDALVGGALRSLRAAAEQLERTPGGPADAEQRITAALPPDAPREVRNALLALVRENALDRLPGIIRAFERLSAGEVQALEGEVTSAVPLSQAQQDHITRDLRARYSDQLALRFTVDPSLIGGLVIRVGDQVLDNSLRTRLSAIQRNMMAS